METAKINTRLAWIITDDNMTCTFPGGIKQTFVYADIKDWDKSHMEPLVAGLFQHGLKQKLADCVAGGTKNGISFPDQAKAMSEKWEDIRTGIAKERKNAKIDPMVAVFLTIDNLVGPDGQPYSDAVKAHLKAQLLKK